MVPEPATQQPSLLVVDDDVAILESLQALFAERDYRVTTARNGAQALAEVRQRRVTVVLTDIFMPNMDGLELIAALRSADRGALIVAMSGGHNGFNPLPFATKLGADLFITKPFRIHDLVAAIDRLVRGSQPLSN